ncbi:MAG: radical SAM protein, partial [Deltaproteobacteria bacterium]|nr:radical SAM protein [Deltaproteobacteria bacterium]
GSFAAYRRALAPLLDALTSGAPRRQVLRELALRPGFFVPSEHGDALPPVAKCDDSQLPACSSVWTPAATLADMFLIETSRGCSRGCTFCVMRRSTNGGMRIVPAERVLSLIPEAAPRVGLVGAAVSDHPRIVDIVRAIVDRGQGVGLSSLRADKLTPEFVEALKRGGYRTLTVASDGASERLRSLIERKIREKHLLRAAELAGAHDIPQLKVYMMIGVPGETHDDLDELVAFSHRQADAAGPRTKIHLSIAPFVSKRNTPLDGLPFVGIREAEVRLARLRAGLLPRVHMRATSARWAWVEYMLAQGGPSAGLAVREAWERGGSFAAYRRALAPLAAQTPRAPAPQLRSA